MKKQGKTNWYLDPYGVEKTAERMADPQPGDRFSEMMSFYMHVVHRDGQKVVVEHYSPPCSVPDDAVTIVYESVESFRAHYLSKYDQTNEPVPRYWLTYYDDTAPFDHYQKERSAE